jgi:hypothetical protein
MFDLAFAMNHNRVIIDLDGDIFVVRPGSSAAAT